MADTKKKDYKKSVVQLTIGLFIAFSVIGVSWISKRVPLFDFYEKIELQLLDLRFNVRGTIPMNPNVGTIDIDALSLDSEGRYQDWTRDNYAEIMRILKDLDIRMIAFDMFFVEESGSLLKREDFENAQVTSLEEVSGLFRDYDEEMRQAMIYADNVILGQSFIKAENQTVDWVRENTVKKDENKALAVQLQEPYYKDNENWIEGKYTYYVDIEPPRPSLIEVSKGVGFAMTESDIDGSVRHYPIILAYDDTISPSLALVMILKYIGAEFRDVEIIPGEEIILPPGNLPDGTEVNIRIPINDRGLMLVNWAGGWAENQFFHIPHIALVKNKTAWEHATIAKAIKKFFQEYPEEVSNLERAAEMLKEQGIELTDEVIEIFSTLNGANYLETEFINQGIALEEGDLPEDAFVFYQEILINNKIADAFAEIPDLTFDEMKDKIGERNEAKILRGYNILKDRINKWGVKPDE